MTKISETQRIYIYGNFCGSLIIYSGPKPSSNLEGFFISSEKIIPDEHRDGTIVEYSEKKNFEKEHRGRFISFEN